MSQLVSDISSEDFVTNDKESKSYWGLRCMWLSDPEKWISQALHSFENHHAVFHVAQKINSEASSIMWWDLHEGYAPYASQVLLLPSNFNLYQKDSLNRIMIHGVPFPFRVSQKYHFSHGLSEKVWGDKSIIASYFFDPKAIKETIEGLWIQKFQEFEKQLANLALFSNHDYTMHRQGIYNNFFEKYIWEVFDCPELNIWGNTEMLAAIFHKDLLSQWDEKGLSIVEKTYTSIEGLAKMLVSLDNAKLQSYWMNILKYFMYSIIWADDTKLEQISQLYPSLNFSQTSWGEIVNQNSISFSIEGIKYELEVRKAREHIMKSLRSRSPGAIEEFNAFVKQEGRVSES